MLDSPVLLVGLGTVFLVIALGAVFGIQLLLNPKRSADDRLREITGGPSADGEEDTAVAAAIAERLSTLAAPSDDEELGILKAKLYQAGYRSKRAVELFNGLRVGLCFGLPVVLSPILANLGSWLWMSGGVVFFALVGYMVPMMVVNSRITARQQVLLKPFPDALDLLVTSVEAGLGIDAAFRRVADEIGGAAPELAAEFQMVNHEINAGVPRVQAMKHMAERSGLDEIKSLVNMLTQAERFGTSIARALRIHAETTRQKRMSAAEEKAAQVSPKLTIVMILFLMPCLMVILLGPAALRVIAQFTQNVP